MRVIPLLIIAAAAAGCASAPPAPTRTAEGQAKLQQLTAGRVAGAPVTCLPPSISSRNMVVIDDSTVAFEGGGRTYLNHLRGECTNLDSGFYSLVIRSGGSGTCSGDIASVEDVRTGTSSGSCSLGEFIPYTRAGG